MLGLIARFCKALQPPAWHPPAAEIELLQALMRRIEAIGQMRQQEKNRLEVTHSPVVQESITAHIQFLGNEIAKTRQLIDDHIKQHSNL